MTPPASVEPVRVFRYKHRNVSLRGEDPTPPVTTLFMAYDPLPGTSYSGEDGRWLPVDDYNALLARANTAKVAADLMRARAERAEAALKFYADPENHERPLVVDDEVGGTVPPNCPDKDAHLREKFRDCGFPVPLPVVPHDCGAGEEDETEPHTIAGVRRADYGPVALDGGAKARAALRAGGG